MLAPIYGTGYSKESIEPSPSPSHRIAGKEIDLYSPADFVKLSNNVGRPDLTAAYIIVSFNPEKASS
jgi:hypothetical protein